MHTNNYMCTTLYTAVLHDAVLYCIQYRRWCSAGRPLGPLLLYLVLHQVVCAIATDSECASLLFHRWYIDDGVVAGPISAVVTCAYYDKSLGPPLGLHINLSKCELFSVHVDDLNMFPDEMKKSNVPHFDIHVLYYLGPQLEIFSFVPNMLLKRVQTPPGCPAISPGGIFRSSCSHASTPSMWEFLQVDTLGQNYPTFFSW